jgi:hypothetical protein
MTALQFRPATRSRRRPLIGLYGLSGSGKTLSALLLARGLVGPTGKIAMIDTESGRGSDYVDVIPGGYDVLDLGEPFSPAHYIEAIDALVRAKPDVGVIDSVSHEWEGTGGVTEMAAEIEIKSGKSGLHCWKEPKMQHARMMLKLLRTPMPVICCLRAKRKSRQVKDGKSRTQIVKDEFATPKQDGDFIFEMTVHAEIMLTDHTLRVTKTGHPDLAQIFKTGEVVTIETGQRLADWCAGKEVKAAAPPKAKPPPHPPTGEGETASRAQADRQAPSYHPDMHTLHKELREGLMATREPEAWWKNHPKGIGALKESAPGLWEDLRQLAARKKSGAML